MEVKEAIDRLEDFISDFEAEGNRGMVEEYKEVIALLEQGEKYKKMWEEDAKDWLGNDLDLKEWMNDTKQKYFPKEAKQDYPESEE